MPVNRNQQPAPQRQHVLSFVSPDVRDILFYETHDTQRIGTDIPEYGTRHPDKKKWPHHVLIHAAQDSDDGQLYRFYYAADRQDQDIYNYELRDGEELTRTYIIRREDYPSKLPAPAGGTLDSEFTDYGFVGDSIRSLEEPLRGKFIAIQRRYIIPQVVDKVYDPNLETRVTVTKTVVAYDYDIDQHTDVAGDTYELRHGNAFHKVLIRKQLPDAGDDRALPVLYSAQKYEGIPERLDSVTFDYVSCWATNGTESQFSEDNASHFETTEPISGPYKTKITRVVTSDPEGVVDSTLAAATFLPRPRREDITIKYGAISFDPVVARAQSRQYPLPAAIHGPITVAITGVPLGSSGGPTVSRILEPENLPTSIGFQDQGGGNYDLVGDYLIDVDVRKTSLEMHIVTSTELVLTGVYS